MGRFEGVSACGHGVDTVEEDLRVFLFLCAECMRDVRGMLKRWILLCEWDFCCIFAPNLHIIKYEKAMVIMYCSDGQSVDYGTNGVVG